MAAGYHEKLRRELTEALREKVKELPDFCSRFLYAIEDTASARTRLAYATDLLVFFRFLVYELGGFDAETPGDFTIEHIKAVTPENIEEYMSYLSYYVYKGEDGSGLERVNAERGKSRKLFSVRSLFAYLFKRRLIDSNIAAIVDPPKLRDKAKTFLEPGEVSRLLDEIESGEGLTAGQLKYHRYTKARDLALITLFLGTGIRISELVGLDIKHINFEDGSFVVTRKGGSEAILYFGHEVEQALRDYLDVREELNPLPGHEEALFISLKRRRVCCSAVQRLVKKYCRAVTPLKKITPHKLRTTFGTNLYRETGDIYIVADILGHKDINTTRKHYADTSEAGKRATLRSVRLRDD
jgi:site-specific recombinase XerD